MWHPSHVPFRDHIGAILQIQGTHIVVTPDLIFEVLHVPRVAHPGYPDCDRHRTVSEDELMSLFYETIFLG